MALVNIKINGQPYQVEAGLTVLEAAKKCGYQIPSLCALGQTATNPILSTIKAFPEEYEAHVKDHKCPAHVCKNMMEYHIIPEKCMGCGLCQRGCPADCISATEQPAKIPGKFVLKIDPSKCVKCGSCEAACRFGSIIKR